MDTMAIRYLALVINLSLIVAPAIAQLAEPATLNEKVTHVRDGDTIEIGKVPIRLNGVSAPELKEPQGDQSKQFMKRLVEGKKVRCELDGANTYDRYVGTCFLNDKNIGISIIVSGLAIDCPRYSKGRYAKYETEAAKRSIKPPKYCRVK
jgi:endonuclease YncB( thermonuclease family)